MSLLPRHFVAAAIFLAWIGQADCAVRAADRLILRNLDFVLDRTVVEMDEDGVRLDAARGGSDLLRWDEIERGTVALDQSRFDQLLAELGLPLYRIRQRLKTGDYQALAEPAGQLYPRFQNRTSPTASMVCQAQLWSLLAVGQREAAVEPYLRCYQLLRSGSIKSGSVPGDRRLQFDPQSALSPELTPLWFDAAAAKEALPGVQQAIRTLTQPRPDGVYLYYATLALAAGETAEAERVLKSIRGDNPTSAGWKSIVLAQQEVQSGKAGPQVDALQSTMDALPEQCRAAALYWVGLARVASADEALVRDGVLDLLRLPAEYGQRDPELAAAGLYQAAAALGKLKDDRGSGALRSELVAAYPSTYYGRKIRAEKSD